MKYAIHAWGMLILEVIKYGFIAFVISEYWLGVENSGLAIIIASVLLWLQIIYGYLIGTPLIIGALNGGESKKSGIPIWELLIVGFGIALSWSVISKLVQI